MICLVCGSSLQYCVLLCCSVSCCVLQIHLNRPNLNVFCAVHFNALWSWLGGFVAWSTNELSRGKMLRFVMIGMSVVMTLILIVMALYMHALQRRPFTQPENLGSEIEQGSLYKATIAPFLSVNLGWPVTPFCDIKEYWESIKQEQGSLFVLETLSSNLTQTPFFVTNESGGQGSLYEATTALS